MVGLVIVLAGILAIVAILWNAHRHVWDGSRGDIVMPTRADRKTRKLRQ
jgi:hypothetical protein